MKLIKTVGENFALKQKLGPDIGIITDEDTIQLKSGMVCIVALYISNVQKSALPCTTGKLESHDGTYRIQQ